MTYFLLIIATGLSMLLAGRRFQHRDEITALASVKCLAKKPTSRSKELF